MKRTTVSRGEFETTAPIVNFDLTFLVYYEVEQDRSGPEPGPFCEVRKLEVSDGHGKDITEKLRKSYPSTYGDLEKQAIEQSLNEEKTA